MRRPPAQTKRAPFLSDACLVGLHKSTTWYWSCEEKEIQPQTILLQEKK